MSKKIETLIIWILFITVTLNLGIVLSSSVDSVPSVNRILLSVLVMCILSFRDGMVQASVKYDRIYRMIDVWTLEHLDLGGGYTVDDPQTLIDEIEYQIEEEDYKCDLPTLDDLNNMKDDDTWESGPFRIKKSKMRKIDFDNLREFDGW